jgi:hypothetical protein
MQAKLRIRCVLWVFLRFSRKYHQGDIISTRLRHWSHGVTTSSIWFYLGKAGQAISLHSNLLRKTEKLRFTVGLKYYFP